MKRYFVSYHYPCPDGIFAALAVRQHFAEAGIQRVHYVPNKVFAPVSLKDLDLTVSSDQVLAIQIRKTFGDCCLRALKEHACHRRSTPTHLA